MWFFNKNKKEETNKDIMDVLVEEEAVSKEDKDKVKAIANRFFPNNYKTVSGQQMVLELLTGLVNLETIENKTENDWQRAIESKKIEDLVNATRANASCVDQELSLLDYKQVEQLLVDSDFDTLLKYWIALDYYQFVLNNNYCMNISVMNDDIVRELKKKGLDDIKVRKYTDLELAQKQAHDLEKTDPNSDAYKEAKKVLGNLLLESDHIFVGFDTDFNQVYPYLALDGRIEVTTNKERADSLQAHYKEKQLGNILMREVNHEDIESFFDFALSLGIHALRLDNGFLPVNLFFYDFIEYKEKNITEIYNRTMRAQFIHLLQMSYRLRKLDENADLNLRKKMTEILLTAKSNGYRNLGNGLVYVISKSQEESDQVYYSEKALEQAKTFLNNKNLSHELLNINGQEPLVYQEPLSLRLINHKQNNNVVRFLCAYTQFEEANKVKNKMKVKDASDKIVIITYDELMHHAKQCGGILIDMLAYGLQIPANDYAEIDKWKEVKGPIVIKLKD